MTKKAEIVNDRQRRIRTRRRLFRMPDGKIFRAHDFEELALKMREDAFFPCKDLNEYMLEMAKRVYIMHSVQICAWSPNEFIGDLIHYKIINEIVPN